MTTTEKFQQKLSDSKSARWTALLIVSFTMMFGYFFTDVMSPLEPLLTAAKEDGGLGLGWSSDEYGFFSGAYGYFNVFLLLLFFGGIILDKFGIRQVHPAFLSGSRIHPAFHHLPVFPRHVESKSAFRLQSFEMPVIPRRRQSRQQMHALHGVLQHHLGDTGRGSEISVYLERRLSLIHISEPTRH